MEGHLVVLQDRAESSLSPLLPTPAAAHPTVLPGDATIKLTILIAAGGKSKQQRWSNAPLRGNKKTASRLSRERELQGFLQKVNPSGLALFC